MESSGCLICGIICDGATTNRNMWTELGISGILGSIDNSLTHPLKLEKSMFFLMFHIFLKT